MGVYYSAYAGFGLLVEKDSADLDVPFYEFEESLNGNLPDGYGYVTGGNAMSGSNECVLIGPSNLLHRVFDSMDDGFGSRKIEAVKGGITADDAVPVLHELAAQFGVEPNIGFFGISSVY